MKVFFTLSFWVLTKLIVAQTVPVFVDGNFEEWSNSENIYNDLEGDGNTIDLVSLKILNDAENLYFSLKTNEEINLNTDNNLTIYIDSDVNKETGFQINGIGAEIKWIFGLRKGSSYFEGKSTDISQKDLLFRAQPTVSGSKFEMAFNRMSEINGHKLFQNDSINIFIHANETSGDYLPNEGESILYIFDNTEIPAYEEISLTRISENHIRVMTFNVLHDGITKTDRQPYFERMIQAVNPDIIAFNECWDSQASDIQQLLNDWLPQNETWHTNKTVYGNITASKFPILKSDEVVPDKRLAASLIDLPEKYGKDIMVVNCHLKCCNSTSDNSKRQFEVDGLQSYIQKIKNNESDFEIESNTPFLYMGDFNLVGKAQQLKTLELGEIKDTAYWGQGGSPDWDNQPMGNVLSKGVGLNMAYTWRDDFSSYWPGRLDYIFFTQSELKLEKSFILETAYMSDESLIENKLHADDSKNASDHLPHVADFSLKNYNTINAIIENPFTIYPNPCNDIITIHNDNRASIYEIKISTVEGVVLKTILASSNQSYTLNISDINSGIYLINVVSNKGNYSQKIIKLK